MKLILCPECEEALIETWIGQVWIVVRGEVFCASETFYHCKTCEEDFLDFLDPAPCVVEDLIQQLSERFQTDGAQLLRQTDASLRYDFERKAEPNHV